MTIYVAFAKQIIERRMNEAFSFKEKILQMSGALTESTGKSSQTLFWGTLEQKILYSLKIMTGLLTPWIRPCQTWINILWSIFFLIYVIITHRQTEDNDLLK